jgi:hypothetical protein
MIEDVEIKIELSRVRESKRAQGTLRLEDEREAQTTLTIECRHIWLLENSRFSGGLCCCLKLLLLDLLLITYSQIRACA